MNFAATLWGCNFINLSILNQINEKCINYFVLFVLGEGTGLLRLHSTYRHDLKIYSSDEGRVQVMHPNLLSIPVSVYLMHVDIQRYTWVALGRVSPILFRFLMICSPALTCFWIFLLFISYLFAMSRCQQLLLLRAFLTWKDN